MRLVQIGLGLWGLSWAREVLPTVDEVEPVAWVDGDPAARARAIEAGLPADRLFGSLGEALAAQPAEAALATVPLAAHAAACDLALDHGLHVLVEKPFAESLAEAERLTAKAESLGRLLLVNQNYRHFAHSRKTRQLIADGAIGQPQAVRITFKRLFGENYRYFFLAQPLLSDMAIHHFDLMRFILQDEPTAVSCRAWSEADSRFAGPPAAAATIRFSKGLIVHYFGSWISRAPATPYGAEWEIDGSQASLVMSFRGDPGMRHAQDRLELHVPGLPATTPALERLAHEDRAGTLAAFAAAVKRAERPETLSTARDNLSSLALMFGAIRSAESGGVLVEI